MTRLALLIYLVAAPTLAGISMMVVLVIGKDTGNPIMLSVLFGTILAIPVSWFVAKKLLSVKGLITSA